MLGAGAGDPGIRALARLTLDGVPARLLPGRWGAPQVGLFRSLPSTLDAIHELAAQGAPPGSVVLAESQTAGRGRDGRTWRSPPGGVWLGLLLQPAGAEAPTIAIRAGLVLADALDAVLGRAAAQLKWPNDIVLDDRKVGGILCEARWQGEALQWLALGVGVNVVNEIPAELRDRAIALRDLVPGVGRLALLDRIVPALSRLAAGGARLTDPELAAYAARDWLRGRQLRSPLFGRASGLRPDGALLVELGAGTAAVREGHVELA